MSEMTEHKTTPGKRIALLFFGTYLGAIVAYYLSSGAASIFLKEPQWLIVVILLFPGGLLGFADAGVAGIIPGYVIYCLIFGLALKFRKQWQTYLMWVILLLLVILNIAGCAHVSEHIMDHPLP